MTNAASIDSITHADPSLIHLSIPHKIYRKDLSNIYLELITVSFVQLT